ncbi:hypothetical protein KI387_006043, partial [Taxus chinensis]
AVLRWMGGGASGDRPRSRGRPRGGQQGAGSGLGSLQGRVRRGMGIGNRGDRGFRGGTGSGSLSVGGKGQGCPGSEVGQ